MLSPEYGILFLAAAGFLLLVLILTQIVPGGRPPKDQFLPDDEAASTETFLRTIAPQEEEPTGALTRLDDSFAQMIHRADMKISPDQALGIMMLTGMLAAAALYLWRNEIWQSAVGLFGGMLLIFGYYYVKQLGYRRRLQNQIPDAIFLIARSVRAGLSLEQAIDQAALQGVEPLAGEFKQAARQIRLGLAVPAALQRIGKRIRLVDFDAFISTVAVYSRTGGNLPLLLERLAGSVRDHNQFRGYFFAATAQARVTALFIGLATPLLLIAYLVLDPEHLQTFFHQETGWLILAGCFVLELIGAYWLYRMLKIDYY
jgi:tight adherence protein B